MFKLFALEINNSDANQPNYQSSNCDNLSVGAAFEVIQSLRLPESPWLHESIKGNY